MKIAVIVDHDVGLLCGASLQGRQLAEWLAENGHDVLLIFPAMDGEGRARHRGGIRAQIVDRKTGILVRRMDEEEFGRRFFELYENPSLQDEIRLQAREDVLVNNSPDKIYRSLLSIYERAVRGEKPHPGEIDQTFTYDRSFLDSRTSPDKHQS